MARVVAQTLQEGAMMVDYDPNRAHGGKTVYGASVGILMLGPAFPASQAISATPRLGRSRSSTGSSAAPPARVTTAKANDRSTGLLDAFLAAAAELVQDGADGITIIRGMSHKRPARRGV